MRNIGFQAIATLALLASVPQAAKAPLGPTDKPGKKICKAIVKTGSIMAQRFCLTEAEWQEFNDINGKTVDSFLHQRGTGMCDGKCEK